MFKKILIVGVALFITFLIIVAINTPTQNKVIQEDEVMSPATEPDNGVDSEEPSEQPLEQGEEPTLPEAGIQRMDKGRSVQSLQELLKKIGYSINVTSKFNDETTWAITDFQLQNKKLDATGIYDQKTKKRLQEVLDETLTIDPGSRLSKPKQDQHTNKTKVIGNPYEILSIINKHHALPDDYIPEDLVIPNVRFPFQEDLPKKQLRKVAADALEELMEAADEEGLTIFAQSGYRSYDRQDIIFAANVDEHGEKEANNFSARPGESEHQSGLTMDITTPDIDYDLTIEFGETDEGKWVQQHASEFGFIIRYPEDKEEITEYQYEPWHLRYVGTRAAKEIMNQNITLEEYLGLE